MIHCRSLACFLAIATPSISQVPILDVTGGSLPGDVNLKLAGGAPGTVAAIFLGENTGPTPLSLLDPRDPRFIDIGLEMIDVTQVGFFDMNGCFAPPTISVPNLPQLVDADFYFQGITLPGVTMPQLPTLVGEISAVHGIRMGPAAQFRDRFTQLGVARTFAQILPRSDGTWMIIGGGQGGLLSQLAQRTTEIYDPIQDVFTPGPLMVNGRSIFTATELMDGRSLSAGDQNVA